MPSRKRADGGQAGPQGAVPRRNLGPLALTTTTTIAMGGVILLLIACVVYGAAATVRSAEDTARAIRISDDFREAQHAATTQQKELQAFRIQPASGPRDRFVLASQMFDAALERAEQEGDDADQAMLASMREANVAYQESAARLIAAVEERSPQVGRIAARDVSTTYFFLQREADRAAAAHYEAAQEQNDALGDTQKGVLAVTGIGMVLAFALLVMIWRIMIGYQRDLVDAAERSAHEALHDHLTGLPNRNLFEDRLATALAARDTTVATLMLDLDRFKQVNDTLGHHHGDELLRQVGRRLSGVLREGDTVARFGGDEFAVLLPSITSLQDADEAAKRVISAMQESFTVADMRLDVECSVGIALSLQGDDDPGELLRRADVAMYEAKEGPDSVSTYTTGLEADASCRLALFGELRRALEHNELVVHYQPKVDLNVNAVVGVEALARWQHPERGLMQPGEFIPVAEETGLIRSLTEHVLNLALIQARRWLDEGEPLPVAVNLSAKCLQHRDLPTSIDALLSEHGVPAELLRLEITESSVIHDPERAQRVLTELHEAGVRLSIDDFGTGFSSMSSLKRLPVDELKVDRAFITGLNGPDDRALVRALIDLGHHLGLSVVAEGVEDPEVLSFLRRCGCDIAQGFHIARPAPAEALRDWLREHQPRHRPAFRAANRALR